MFAAFTGLAKTQLTLYTDALVARGTIRTRQHRVSDILNLSETPFLILEDVTVTDLDGHSNELQADVAQINLDTVLFAVVDTPVEPSPELRSPKTPHDAIVSVPPFRVSGKLHLMAGSVNLREALGDLTGRFLPVTDAVFESPTLGIAPREALMVAVNHHRAQILASYAQAGDRPVEPEPGTVEDPWAGRVEFPPADPWSDSTGGSQLG